MSKLVVIYNASGTPEKHTLPNARDLVNNAGYAWKLGVEASPVNFAPSHAVPSREEKLALAKKPASQEIFDRYGSTATEEDDPLSHAEQMEEILNETSAPEEAPAEEVIVEAPETQEDAGSVELPRGPSGRRGRRG